MSMSCNVMTFAMVSIFKGTPESKQQMMEEGLT